MKRAKKTDRRGVWLFLRCEGWVRFGPWEWLTFRGEDSAYLNSDGEVVAFWDEREGHWRVPTDEYAHWRFDEVMLNSSADHPAHNQGALPFTSPRCATPPPQPRR